MVPPTNLLTRSLRLTRSILFCLAKHPGTTAKKTNATQFLKAGKCTFKHLITKEKTSWISTMTMAKTICPTYSKGGAWLRHFSLSNTMCARVTRFITNYAPIGDYRKRFFPNESATCSCGHVPLKT